MTNRYAQRPGAGTHLQNALAHYDTEDHEERHDLSSEIDLARLIVASYLDTYESACLDPNSEATPGEKALASSLLQQGLDRVTGMVATSQRMANQDKSRRVAGDAMRWLAAQVRQTVIESLPPHQAGDLLARLAGIDPTMQSSEDDQLRETLHLLDASVPAA